MSVAVPVQILSNRASAVPSWPVLMLCWLLAGAALCAAIGVPAVQRTQEARVLETARQMRGTGWRGWLVPKINGNLRLQKPPLAYWMAALAYDVGGVSATIGRIPTALCGWLTIAVTFAASQRLFGRRAAFLGAAALLCSYLFFRHDRLAETDAPAALFVTCAIYCWIRAVDETEAQEYGAAPRSHPALWFHLGAAATALAILFKGGPGAFPPIFLLFLICVRRTWFAMYRFLTSGAWLTLLVFAAPWFLYAWSTTRTEQFHGEVDTLLSGRDHRGSFWAYGPDLIKALMPWPLVVVAAVVAAIAPLFQRAAQDMGARWTKWSPTPQATAVVWAVSILIPLWILPQKQFHYLLPLMPPLMILVGWLLDLATDRTRETRAIAAIIDGTMLGTILAVPGVIVASQRVTGHVSALDLSLAAIILLAVLCVAAIRFLASRRAAIGAYLLGCALIFPLAIGIWMPLKEPDDSAAVARQIQGRFGKGPYVFYGQVYSLPLCFNLRCEIPLVKSPQDLERAAQQDVNLVAIAQSKAKFAAPPPPEGFAEVMHIATQSQAFDIYRLRQVAIAK